MGTPSPERACALASARPAVRSVFLVLITLSFDRGNGAWLPQGKSSATRARHPNGVIHHGSATSGSRRSWSGLDPCPPQSSNVDDDGVPILCDVRVRARPATAHQALGVGVSELFVRPRCVVVNGSRTEGATSG